VECGRAAALIEQLGIPTVTVTRTGFTGVIENAFSSRGFPKEAAQVKYPAEMFLPGSDLSPIKDKMNRLTAGLIQWEPETKTKGVSPSGMFTINGRNYQDALNNMNNFFLQHLWGDGLPLLPPTEERVKWILTGTDLPEDREIGEVLPRGGIATPKALAVTLAMAGGRPEYMPVLIAAVRAILDPGLKHERMNTTTNSVYPVVIVNGPIAEEIRLNSGYGCLGPDPLQPAGASLGRAIRFVLMDLGGSIPEKTSMSIFGGPARYTGLVFAEDEAGIPKNWKTLSVEQGFDPGTNTVTVYAVSSTTNIPGGETGTKEAVKASLNRAAGCMGIPIGNYWFATYQPKGVAGILLMGRNTAQGLSQSGWAKKEVKQYLWDHSKVPASELGPRFEIWWMPPKDILQDPMPISVDPQGIKIVVAGGKQSGHMMWLQVGCCPKRLVTKKIDLPSNWKDLMDDSIGDLAPGMPRN